MANLNPEQRAREVIDRLLIESGWFIQDKTDLNLTHSIGVAVREYRTDVGTADYVLFVEGKPVGIVEAKRIEEGGKTYSFAKSYRNLFLSLRFFIFHYNVSLL